MPSPNELACLSDDADGIAFTADDDLNAVVGFTGGPDPLILIEDGILIDADNQADNDVFFQIVSDVDHQVRVENDGANRNDGIVIFTDDGDITFTSDAFSEINTDIGIGYNGLTLTTDDGDVFVNSRTAIHAYDQNPAFIFDAMRVFTDGGSVEIDNYGELTASNDGIRVETNTGDISIVAHNSAAAVDIDADYNGISAISGTGNIHVRLADGLVIDPDDAGVTESSIDGSVRATVGKDTTILITNENDDDNTALGIFAQSGNDADDEDTDGDTNADPSVVITTGGGNTITVTGANSYAAGILGRQQGGAASTGSVYIATGTHTVDLVSDVGDVISVTGDDAGGTNDADNIAGILGQVTSNGQGNVSILGGAGLQITVVDNDNDPSDINSAGIAGLAIFGSVDIRTYDTLRTVSTIAVTNGHGIQASGYGVYVVSGSAITTTNEGNGINTLSTGSFIPGDTRITVNNTINAAKHGVASTVNSNDSFAYVTLNANVTAAESAVRVFDSGGANLGIAAGVVVVGDGSGFDPVVDINSNGPTYSTIIMNAGTIRSDGVDLIDQSNDMAINTDNNYTVITNTGSIIGRINLTGDNDTFNNNSSTSWTFTGDSDFAGGSDELNNTGRTVTAVNAAAGELTRLLDLENFNNGDPAETEVGLLTLIDQTAGQTFTQDKTAASGNFDGQGNSTLGVDVVLDVDGVGISDLFLVGTASGSTLIQINDIDTGPGGFNPYGITVVEVMGNDTSTFALAGGFFDKGFFRWTIQQDTLPGLGADVQFPAADRTPETTWELVSAPGPAAFETAQLMTIVQDFWHTSGAVWDEFNFDLLNQAGPGPSTDIKDGPYIPSGSVAGGVNIWGRVTGSSSDRTVSNFNGTEWIDGGYQQKLWGFTGGVDYTMMGSGGALVAGLLGGYGTTNVNFDSGDTAAVKGGSAGAYATWLGGPAYIGALFKADFLDIDYAAGGETANTKGLSLGGKLDAGMRIASAGGGVFFEPNASIAYVSSHINDFTMLGTEVEFTDGTSLRGEVGARLGTTIVAGGSVIEPYVSAAVGNEFLGQYSVFLDSGPGITVGDDISGIYGDVGGGVTLKGTNSAFQAFAKGQYIFAEEYYNIIGKAGVRVGF